MSIDPSRPPSVASEGPGIRRGAVFLAAIVGIVHAGILWIFRGRAPSDAVLAGVSMGVAGLIQWFVYHRVGRRNDGLFLVMFGGLPFNQGVKPPIISSLLIGAMLAAAFGVLLGLISRGADRPSRDVASEDDPVEPGRYEEAGGSGPDDSRA